MNYNVDAGILEGTWKVPDVENIGRQMEEGSRFYRLQPQEKRRHGLKYIPPPKGTIQQLRDEEKYYHTNQPNYLLN